MTTELPKPTNAYEACQMAASMIATNPWSYIQEVFCTHRVYVGGDFGDKLRANLTRPENECGTAFCRAGWLVTLALKNTEIYGEVFPGKQSSWDWVNLLRYAMDLDWDEWTFNKTQFAKDLDILISGDAIAYTYGTDEYALEGARGLRAFADTYRARLEAVTYPRPMDFVSFMKNSSQDRGSLR